MPMTTAAVANGFCMPAIKAPIKYPALLLEDDNDNDACLCLFTPSSSAPGPSSSDDEASVAVVSGTTHHGTSDADRSSMACCNKSRTPLLGKLEGCAAAAAGW